MYEEKKWEAEKIMRTRIVDMQRLYGEEYGAWSTGAASLPDTPRSNTPEVSPQRENIHDPVTMPEGLSHDELFETMLACAGASGIEDFIYTVNDLQGGCEFAVNCIRALQSLVVIQQCFRGRDEERLSQQRLAIIQACQRAQHTLSQETVGSRPSVIMGEVRSLLSLLTLVIDMYSPLCSDLSTLTSPL